MREGALHGALLGTRVLGAVSVLLLLSSTARAHQIFNALRWFGVPKGWVEVGMLMYRYIFMLLDLAADVMNAPEGAARVFQPQTFFSVYGRIGGNGDTSCDGPGDSHL